MTETFYKTGTHKVDINVFGGNIDIDDFNTNKPNKNRISNQMDAINFKNITKEKKYKNMTLEELKELKLISNTDGRPNSLMTDEKWQKEFYIRKLLTTPHPKHIKRMSARYSRESGIWNEETQGTYHGCTNWQSYCSYINDILSVIRSGQVDYCYYIYQITELLKFHYDSLRTKYVDGYWEVWLER